MKALFKPVLMIVLLGLAIISETRDSSYSYDDYYVFGSYCETVRDGNTIAQPSNEC